MQRSWLLMTRNGTLCLSGSSTEETTQPPAYQGAGGTSGRIYKMKNKTTSAENMTDLHRLCVQLVNEMVEAGITRHISYIGSDDDITFLMIPNGKVMKVTVEWVDASEMDPGKF